MLVGDYFDAVLLEQGSGDTRLRGEAAGRAAGFEQAATDLSHPGNGQHHAGTAQKMIGAVHAISIDDPSGADKDIVAITANDFRRGSRGGESAELFGADGAPVEIGQVAQTGGIGFAPAVVAGAEADEAGADQAMWLRAVHEVEVLIESGSWLWR